MSRTDFQTLKTNSLDVENGGISLNHSSLIEFEARDVGNYHIPTSYCRGVINDFIGELPLGLGKEYAVSYDLWLAATVELMNAIGELSHKKLSINLSSKNTETNTKEINTTNN